MDDQTCVMCINCDRCKQELFDWQINGAICTITGELVALCDTCYELLPEVLVEPVLFD